MVRMLLIVHFNNRKLPDQRADLYLKAVDAMLRPDYNLDQSVSDEIEHRVAGSLAMNREMLQYLAYHMHRKGEDQGREIAEENLREILNQEPAYAPFVDELIAQTRQRGTLLEERGGLYRFLHLSFQEFLVARYFVEYVRELEQIAAMLEGGLALDSWWREPILLTAGYLDLTAPVMARRFLLRLAGADPGASTRAVSCSFDLQLASGELAASAYLECKAQPPDLAEVLKTRLLDLHRLGKKETWTPAIMAAAADSLDELGYDPGDLYAFVPIRSGDFSRPGTAEAVTTGEFYLARYPVTNLQYERFLRRENFADERLWRDFPKYDEKGNFMVGQTWGAQGWDWLQGALKDEDYLVEDGVLLPRYWRDPRFGVARKSAPVVGISWYEANAYCRWLAAHWQEQPEAEGLRAFVPGRQGLTFRLPTEAEWVTAAGGEQHNRFAWDVVANEVKQSPGSGGKPSKREIAAPPPASRNDITRYANTAESGLNRTTPVWTYPQGASPLQVMDMSGNVWEWMANYRNVKEGWLALRGGSWLDLRNLARVADRNYALPAYWYDYFGVRLAAFPNE